MGNTEFSPEFIHQQTPEELAISLGFIEPSELLLDLRTAIVLEYSIDQERAIELKTLYQDAGRKIIRDIADPQRYSSAALGLELMCASMKLRAGLTTDYNHELLDILELADQHTYAYNRGDNTLIDQIESLIIQPHQEL